MSGHFSLAEATALADPLVRAGLHPSTVRRRLSERGIRWQYVFLGQGTRERLRRLRQQGLGLCSMCHRQPYTLGAAINVCPACLEEKWATEHP